MPEEKKKYKNLSTYAVCMILTVIILILIAAMADNREAHFESQLNEKEQVNMDIQNQIVALSDETYRLQKELTAQEEEAKAQGASLAFYQTMTEAFSAYVSGDKAGAAEKLSAIDQTTLSEEQQTTYQTLAALLN